MISTIQVQVQSNENLIERIGTTVSADDVSSTDGSKLFLAEKIADDQYKIIGFSDESVKELTDLEEIKRVFVSKFLKACKFAKEYRREHRAWGHWGLYRDVEYFEYLAEQTHKLLQNGGDSLTFWREKSRYMGFTKDDFRGKGGYYVEYPSEEVKA